MLACVRAHARKYDLLSIIWLSKIIYHCAWNLKLLLLTIEGILVFMFTSVVIIIIIIIIIIYALSVFNPSVCWWFSAGVRVTASLFQSLGLFLVFWPISTML